MAGSVRPPRGSGPDCRECSIRSRGVTGNPVGRAGSHEPRSASTQLKPRAISTLWTNIPCFKRGKRPMTTILDEIVASKRREVDAARLRMPLAEMEDQAAAAPPVRDFRAALAGPGPIQLIAEVKKASPSADVIRADFDPIAIARTYQAHGAACLSVLTDAPYFQGHLSYLARIRASVAIPLLRKDFLIDEYQVVEARLAGADAVLLIAEILDDATMAALLARARGLGMAALVEFHDEANLPRVLAAGADLVGINNRDLRHF